MYLLDLWNGTVGFEFLRRTPNATISIRYCIHGLSLLQNIHNLIFPRRERYGHTYCATKSPNFSHWTNSAAIKNYEKEDPVGAKLQSPSKSVQRQTKQDQKEVHVFVVHLQKLAKV